MSLPCTMNLPEMTVVWNEDLSVNLSPPPSFMLEIAMLIENKTINHSAVKPILKEWHKWAWQTFGEQIKHWSRPEVMEEISRK